MATRSAKIDQKADLIWAIADTRCVSVIAVGSLWKER